MADMLFSLLNLPPSAPIVDELKAQGVTIRRANPFEWTALRLFCEEHFAVTWADEATCGLSNKPVTTYIAVENKKIIGFGSYECTRRDYFGPTGVAKEHRGRNIGKALLLVCLEGLRDMGYAYAVIGGVGPKDFYARVVGAFEIPDSTPGVYSDLLG